MAESTKTLQKKDDKKRVKRKKAKGGHRWHTIEEYADALKKHCGVVTAAANELGVVRKAVYERLEKSEYLRRVRRESEITVTHKAEHNIYSGIMAGNLSSSIFYLRTKGRDRGWSQESNVTIHNYKSDAEYEIKPGMGAKDAAKLYQEMMSDE